jgi:hypothetical protein
MIVLGLLLVLLAVGAAALALTAPVAPTQLIEMTPLGFNVSASPRAIFLAGAMSVVLLGLGLALVSQGTRRKTRARKELRGLRKDQAAAAAETSADTENTYSRRHGPADSAKPNATKAGNQDSGPESQPERAPGSQPSH